MVVRPKPVSLDEIKKMWVKTLIYGKSGDGKTIFASGYPKPLMLLDTDMGILSVKSASHVEHKDQIYPIPVKDLVEGQAAPQGYDTVEAIMQDLVSKGAYEGLTPKTLVIDSVTTLSQMCMNKTQYLNGHLGQQPTLPDYGGQRRLLEKIIKFGVAIKMHFMAICHQDFYKDENTGRLWLTPMVVGKLRQELPLYFDEVYHCAPTQLKDGTEYKMETEASGIVTAKSRLGLKGVVRQDWKEIEPFLARAQGRDTLTSKEEGVTATGSEEIWDLK